MIFRTDRCPCMKIFSDLNVTRHLAIGLLVAAATFGFATSTQARILIGSPGTGSLSNGLVGYWPLDGAVTNWTANTTRDLSGNNNTGTLVSLATTTAPAAGKIGQALKFNGGSSYIDFGVPSAT